MLKVKMTFWKTSYEKGEKMTESKEQATKAGNNNSFERVIQNNLFIVKYLARYTPVFLLMTFLVSAIHEVVVFFEHTYCIKYLTDIIQYNGPFYNVVRYISIMTVLVVLKILLVKYYNEYLQPKAKEKLHKQMNMELYDKAVKLDLACYDNPAFYNDFVWSISEATKRIDQTIDYLFQLAGCITVIFTTGTLFIMLNSVGLIFVAVSFALTIIVNISLNKLRYKMDAELIPEQRKRNYINRVFYLADYAKEIRLSNVAEKLKSDFNKTNGDMYGIIDKNSRKQVLLGFLSDYVFSGFILDGLYISYLLFIAVVRKAISYGSIIALFNSSWNLKSRLQRMTSLIPLFQQNSLYIERIRTFLEYEEVVRNCENPETVPETPCSLELRNVSFSYSESSKKVLKNISLSIKPCEKIAFVGYNGAGKTTLTKLLMRLYDVSEGEILLNDVNIKNYGLESYRNSMKAVFQDYQMFAASIAENVIMDEVSGIPGETIVKALEDSGFKDKLMSLEKGINTHLTREFDETGINISGGEAQKIAISRVFAKSCQLIILDEPSSALDPISEYNLNEAMLEAAKNKTVIFISHRLSSTRMADRIYMLENGSIIEEGSHDELMALGGKYAEMFNLQAEKYRWAEYGKAE